MLLSRIITSKFPTCPKGTPRSVRPTIPQQKIKKLISARKGQTPRKLDPKREAGLPPNSLGSSCSLATHSYHNQFLFVPISINLLHSGLASAQLDCPALHSTPVLHALLSVHAPPPTLRWPLGGAPLRPQCPVISVSFRQQEGKQTPWYDGDPGPAVGLSWGTPPRH